jgi:hypothetical protein
MCKLCVTAYPQAQNTTPNSSIPRRAFTSAPIQAAKAHIANPALISSPVTLIAYPLSRWT